MRRPQVVHMQTRLKAVDACAGSYGLGIVRGHLMEVRREFFVGEFGWM